MNEACRSSLGCSPLGIQISLRSDELPQWCAATWFCRATMDSSVASGTSPIMLADEVNGQVGLLEAALDDGHQLAGDQRERLLGEDRVSQLDQLAAQLVALRFEVRGRGGQEDGLGIRGPLAARGPGLHPGT